MSELNIAVIGLPGKWSTEVLADAVHVKTGRRTVVDMADVCLDLDTRQVRVGDINLSEFDAVIVKKISETYSPSTLDRLEILRILEAQGVQVFSGAENILRLINRLSCTVTLRNHDIPMPPTTITESIDEAVDAVKAYGETVFKPLYSTKARGMCVIKDNDNDAVLREEIEHFKAEHQVMYIQKKLSLPGKDLGMVFLGGEYLGTYARVAQSDSWNTTINSGGKYEAYTPSDEIIELATRAQEPFNMDFTTVDVAESEIGPIVFEVSAFGGFRGAKEGIGIDTAKRYVDYVLEKLEATA
ncbi:GAK system ATP-grasp enzyme [Enterovibrio coralii]|uniref:Glutathione synthase n=1 Tax=Enterovibrio coralii TaxID=294935 RepID=A0A135I8U2_9GAMM|nr:GAK system ATP-grasp enzyme [Enterovibrio coralii]KXF81873.1 glutathione synthase [Enterovibrio coralii]